MATPLCLCVCAGQMQGGSQTAGRALESCGGQRLDRAEDSGEEDDPGLWGSCRRARGATRVVQACQPPDSRNGGWRQVWGSQRSWVTRKSRQGPSRTLSQADLGSCPSAPLTKVIETQSHPAGACVKTVRMNTRGRQSPTRTGTC